MPVADALAVGTHDVPRIDFGVMRRAMSCSPKTPEIAGNQKVSGQAIAGWVVKAIGGPVLVIAAACGWYGVAVTVGGTPVAQWSRWITPFGVSGVLYLVNVLLMPENSAEISRIIRG